MLKKTGFYYFLHGFQLITRPGIKRFVILPILLNLLVFLAIFLVAHHFMGEMNHWIANLLPKWLSWISNILWLLFVISFLLMFVYTYVTLSNLVSAPFNGLLAEKIALYLTQQPLADFGLLATLKDTPRMCARQLSMIGYFILRAIFIGLLFFIPLVQIIAAPLWFLFHAWFMTLQYVDYPTDNQRIPLKVVKAQLRQKPLLNFSFGIGVLVASMVPILNLFVMPAAIAGATELWLNEYQA